jgi:hypothetical protein
MVGPEFGTRGDAMNGIKGTFKNGQVILDNQADWPEGCRVIVEPVQEQETMGMREEDWPTDPDAVARLLARMDQTEPLLLTPEEEAEWQAAQTAQKEYEIARWDERAKRLHGLFE